MIYIALQCGAGHSVVKGGMRVAVNVVIADRDRESETVSTQQ